MPVVELYVEGKLDSELLNPVLAGIPAINPAFHSKDDLPHVVRRRRRDDERRSPSPPSGATRSYPCFIRDRDFDYEPPSSQVQPEQDKPDGGHPPLGWHWCRTEIESYILDPGIIGQMPGFNVEAFEVALLDVANDIRYYQAARWAVAERGGAVKAAGYPRNRPQALPGEFALPGDLSEGGCLTWATIHVADYRQKVSDALDQHELKSAFEAHKSRFDDAFLGSVANVLLWFSGKDLFAALEGWLASSGPQGYGSAGTLRDKVARWMHDHPEAVLAALPEWRGLRDMLRAL
jgi:hypothetical protein